MNDIINITNSKAFILNDNNLSYKIEQGNANLFIAEFNQDDPKARLFLCSVCKGDVVPGLDIKDDGKTYKLFFVNTSLNEDGSICSLKVSTKKATKSEKQNLVKKIDKFFVYDIYGKDIVQFYLYNQVKDSRNIYSTYRAGLLAKNQTINNIFKEFRVKNKFDKTTIVNDTYYVLDKVAKSMHIKSVSYSKLSNSQLSNLDVENFAKYSGCAFQKINLEPNWNNHDIGSFIGFYGEEKIPVACILKNNKYYLYFNSNNDPVQVSKKIMHKLDSNAYVLYRSFPNAEITYKEVIKHIKSSISTTRIINTIIISLIITLFGLLTPILSQFIYDQLIPSDDYAGVYGCCVVLISIIVGTGCFSLVKNFLSFSISSKIKYSLQIAFFDRIFKLKQSFIKKFAPADLSMRILGVGSIFTSLTSQTFATVLTFIFSFIYVFQMKSFIPSLVAPAVLISLIMFAIMIVFSYIQYRWISKASQIDIDKSSLLFQLIRGITKIRIAGAEERALNIYMDKHLQSSKLGYKTGFYSAFVAMLATVFGSLTTAIFFTIIFLGGLNVSIGGIMGFMSAYGAFSACLYQIPGCYNAFLQAKPWIERLKPIMHEIPEKVSDTKEVEKIRGDIEVSHLSFSYDENGPIVLDDVSFRIKAGEYVGIVGPSGCGKSTLLNLLLGFEIPDKGKIYYDSYDLDDIDKKTLRQNFGVVLQDGDLISGSILDNIIISNPGASLDDVHEVLKKVKLFDEVMAMPMGVQTLLSEGCGLISGGQKQRILIARAILGNPKITFFDEATSALDNTTQAHISNNLDNLGETRVVVAHRLSTIINCDKIFVFNEGKIVETGTYSELLQNKGLFYKLAQRQIA